MKKILAFLLCAVLLLTVAAPAALAETVTETFQICDGTGAPVKTVSLRMSEKMELTAVAENLSGSYQWQIHVSGDVWANIMGANGNRLELSYGLVANLLSGNAAEIRCRLTNGEVRYTESVKVQIQSDATVRKAPAAAPVPGTAPNGDPADGPAPSTYVITIKYQFADGTQAANPWTATVATGSTYTQDVASPAMPCISDGMMIFVALPSATFVSASRLFSVRTDSSAPASFIMRSPSAVACCTLRTACA